MSSRRTSPLAPCLIACLIASSLLAPVAAPAQAPPDPAVLLAGQREAMDRFAFLDGVWSGSAWALSPKGDKHEMTQTERVGTFLGGTVRVIEGRGYDADGTLVFNALGVVSFDERAGEFSMRSYAQGHTGDFVLTPMEHGFTWEIPAGPMTMRYTANVANGTWHEYGERVLPGQDPVRFFEMTLIRVGDTDWPEAGAIGPK